MQVTISCKKIIVLIALFCSVAGCGSKTKDELYAEGLTQIEKGNPAGAIVFLRSALEKDQNYFDARYQLAMAYTATGRYEQAEKEFQKLLRQNPSHAGIKLGLAKVYVSTNKPDQAIETAGEYLKIKPADSSALEIIGVSYTLKNRPVEAEDYLMQAIKSEPGKISAQLELARVYADSGKTRQAKYVLDEVIKENPKSSRAYYMLASLEASLGNKDKALQTYKQISIIYPEDALAIYKAGLINLEMGQLAQAEKAADLLQKKFVKRAEGYRLKGLIYYQNKNYTAAMSELLSSIKIQPSLEAYYFLGLSHYHRGELENALSQFRRILDYNPNFVRARILTAMILLQQKRVDDSIAESNKALSIDENNALAHNILGSAYMAKGMYDEGMKALGRSTQLDPKIIDSHLKKGVFHLSKGKQNEAEIDFTTAVKVAPDVLSTRLVLSSYYMRRGNAAKAMATLREGLAGNRNDAVLLNGMAAIMFDAQKPAEAFGYIRRAKEADPSLYASYFNQATYYATMGDHEKALNEFRTVLGKDPVNEKAMLRMAALLELLNRNDEAYSFYSKAAKTGNSSAFLALAGYHVRKKAFGKAVAVLNEAITADSKNIVAIEMKGRIYLGEKQYKDAIKAFNDLESVAPGRGIPHKVTTYVLMKDVPKALDQARQIITLQPKSAYGYLVLASVHESRDDLGRAIEEVKNGIRVDSRSVEAMMMLGKLHEKRKDTGAAMKAYADAINADRDYAPAYFAQGALLETMGKRKEAIEKYRDSLGKSENYVPALNNLAYLYADGHGSDREALRLAMTAYKLEPGNSGVLDTLGYALMKNGRKEDSRKILEKAAAMLPNNPTVLYHLALSYKAVGDRKQAIEKLSKAIKLGDFPETNQARILLAELNGTNSGRGHK
jgi:putative PEP-CTERM system TPR-repeat lipoprotein